MVSNGESIRRLSQARKNIEQRAGNVCLLMECLHEPILWDFAVLLGQRMLEMTEDDWKGLFRLMLTHAKNDMTIYVILRVVDRVRNIGFRIIVNILFSIPS